MKVPQHQLVARLALALCALIGGAPGATATNPPVINPTPADVSKSGTDGVGGIERTGPKPKMPASGDYAPSQPTLGNGNPLGSTDVGQWIDLGLGLAGHSEPLLTGSGIDGQGHVTLDLSGAKPFAQATLIIGLDAISVPFKGGTLVPRPDLMIVGLPVAADGTLTLAAQLPLPLPSGLALCVQMWMPDTGAAQGFAASNGLELLIR